MNYIEIKNIKINNMIEECISKNQSLNFLKISNLGLKLIGKYLDMYFATKEYPVPPYTDFEDIKEYTTNLDFYEVIINSDFNSATLMESIRNLSNREIQKIQGMRITEGSSYNKINFPEFGFLKKISNQMYNEYLTHLARARAKHGFRCEVQYWGEIKGSPEDQNQASNDYLEKLLNNFTWWNYFEHFKHGMILELRDKTGHGMRWGIDKEFFLGLIEPVDPHLGRKFWEQKPK